MEDKRYKEIMSNLGYPNSQSLLVALQQVANEVAQEKQASYRKIIMEALDAATLDEAENILHSAL